MMGSAPAEERITGEDGVLGDRAEERDAAVAVEVKGNDEDEVFEELMDAHDSLQEEEERKSDAAISNADLDGNSGVSSDKTSAVLDGNSGVDYDEAESFEEAIGTPTVADTSVRKFGLMFAPEKVEGPEEGENVGGIAEANIVDEGGTKEEGLNGDGYEGNTEEGLNSDGYEGNTEEGLNSDGYEGHTEADVEEIHEVHANEETRDDVDELTEKLEAVFEKAESGDSETKDIGVDEGRNNDIDEPTRDLVVVSEKSEDRDLENSTEVEVVCEGNDSVGAGGLDHNGSSSGEILHADEQNEELNENKLAETESAEVEILSAGNHPAALSSVMVDAETESNGHVNGERQSISLGPDLASHDAGAEEPKDEEQRDVSSISGTNHQDDSNGTVKDALAGIGSHDEEKCVQHVTSGDVPVPAMEMTGSPKVEDSTDSVEVVKDIFETIEPSDRSINETLEHRPLVEEPKKETLKTNEESNEKRQSEIQAEAGPGLSSVSAKPNNQAPPSAPAGLGRAAPLLEPAPRAAQQPRVNGAISQAQAQQIEDAANGEADEHDETREKLQMIRVKFLRLAHRLGQTPHNVVVAQVLYRLGLAEQLRGRNGGRVGAFSFDRASAMAEQLEASGQEPLDFSCTIMVLGKSGVGKSATINSIFDEVKFNTDAFAVGTKKVQDVVGTVQGIRVRVIDTPGLLPSWTDQRHNEKILHSVKRFIKKTPPDIVLYLDRLDMQTRDLSDMPLLRTITDIFGPSIWFNAIVVLTHAASAPPDGPNGTASSYDMFVTQRSHVVQQAIRQAAGDMRLMNPVSLVENHSACRTNRAGQRVLPNGQVWKPHLLLLSFASKILAEANTLLKLQDSPPGKPFATRSRSPPLPFLLSSLLQPRPQLKLPDEQFGDEDGLDDDLDESSDSDEENEYDELPPFKRLTKDEVSMLSRSQKKAYFDELEYREKLFMKKQLKEERRRRRMMKKMAAAAEEQPTDYAENAESAQEEASGAASVPVPMPDLALPTSFDSDNPTHRYRYLDTSNQWLVRPVLETHGWDHDVGYEGINVERLFVVREKVPVSFSGQVTKDKKDANVQMELSSSIKHGKGKATSVGFDMQTVGKDLAYTFRSETRFSNYRRNKATAGFSVTHLNDALSAGFKIEDKLILSKWFRMLVTGGAITARGDVAYGGSLDATLKDKDPLGRALLTLGLSVMDWHGDLAIGGNVQSQIPIGRSTNLIARANLNNRGAGQVSLRVNTSEQLQIALLALIPLFKKLVEEKYYLGQR